MKKMRYKTLIIGLLGLLALTACVPRRIPDRDMEAIIRDIFLVNAYRASVASPQTRTIIDSADIYTPILSDYGYDLDAFRRTIDRWALKKSSKLSELIEAATVDIRRENQIYLRRQRVLERLDTLATEHYRDSVYRLADSMWLRPELPELTASERRRLPAPEELRQRYIDHQLQLTLGVEHPRRHPFGPPAPEADSTVQYIVR